LLLFKSFSIFDFFLFIHIQHCAGFLTFSIPLRASAFCCCRNDLIAWYVYLWFFSVKFLLFLFSFLPVFFSSRIFE
jgi:hypothetical protein